MRFRVEDAATVLAAHIGDVLDDVAVTVDGHDRDRQYVVMRLASASRCSWVSISATYTGGLSVTECGEPGGGTVAEVVNSS